jgi:hypothetical protein
MKWIELRQATPQGAGSATLQRLELALLYVFQNFRKAYIGEQANVSSANLYARLAERVGIRDHVTVMDVIMNKTVNNLKVRVPCAAAWHVRLCLVRVFYKDSDKLPS